jgi:hypothetical protein
MLLYYLLIVPMGLVGEKSVTITQYNIPRTSVQYSTCRNVYRIEMPHP